MSVEEFQHAWIVFRNKITFVFYFSLHFRAYFVNFSDIEKMRFKEAWQILLINVQKKWLKVPQNILATLKIICIFRQTIALIMRVNCSKSLNLFRLKKNEETNKEIYHRHSIRFAAAAATSSIHQKRASNTLLPF